MRRLWQLTLMLVLLLGCTSLGGGGAIAQTLHRPGQEASLPLEAVFDDLARASVVYVGESHDSVADHVAQRRILEEVYKRRPTIALGMEMFQRPFQEVLDRYLRGDLTEEELRQQSEFDRRWGFPWEYYAPLLRFAREHRLRVLALNVPTEISRRVAEKGLAGLRGSDRRHVPPASDIRLDNTAYRALLRPIFDEFHEGMGRSLDFETFFLAQVLWDETMADRIATALREAPNQQVMVIVGQGHVAFGYGIPDRVARRLPHQSNLRQRTVLLNPTADLQRWRDDRNTALADYLWIDPPVVSPP